MGDVTRDLPALVARYGQAIDRVLGEGSDEDLVGAALIRERVSRALASGHAELDYPGVEPLLRADARLRERAKAGFATSAVDLLAAARNAVGPGPTGWWFDLGDVADVEVGRGGWFWTAVAGLFLASSISLATDVIGRFLKEGPDFFGTLLTILQASLAVLTGAAFTDAFWRWLDRVAPSRSAVSGPRPRLHAAAAFVALASVGITYLALPRIAVAYNDYGEGQRSKGAVEKAIPALKRAIALDPDLAVAQYNLGSAYEMVHQEEQATSAYRAAVLLDPTLAQAQNNLARLAILEAKQIVVAVVAMDDLLRAATAPGAKTSPDVLYAAYKNRGWAYMALKYPAAAAADLRHALEAKPDGASAHCLLAKVEGEIATSPRGEVDDHWRSCIAFAAGDEAVLPTWLEDARTHLGGKP